MSQLRIILVLVSCILAGGLAWQIMLDPVDPFSRRLATQWLAPGAATIASRDAPSDRESSRDRVEAQLTRSAPYRRYFTQFQASFPGDWSRFLTGIVDQAAATQRIESADAYVADAMAQLRKARGVLAAQAEDAPLERVFDAQAGLAKALSGVDARLCVDFLYGTPGRRFDAFAAGHQALVGELADAQIAAILSGQSARIERASPTDVDFGRIENDLTAKGLAQVEIDGVLDGRWPTPPLDDEHICRAGLAFFEVVRALPEPTRARITALTVDLMARS